MPARLPFRVLGSFAVLLVAAASLFASAGPSPEWIWLQLGGLLMFGLAAAVYLFASPLGGVAAVALLASAGLALIATYWAEPVGVPIGMFLIAALAPMRPPTRPMLLVTALLAAVFCLVQLPSGHETPATAAAVVAGMVFFAGIGTVLRSERTQRERVAALLRQLEDARVAERQASALAGRTAAAREVHDVLAHFLSGLIIQLEAARLQAEATGTDPSLRISVNGALRSARSGLDEAKRAVAALRGEAPVGASDIVHLVEERRLATGAPISFEVTGEIREIGADAGHALYRAAQEALSNVRKHASGAAVRITLAWGDDDVSVTITNEASSAADSSEGWGLTGIRERVEALDGTLRVTHERDRFTVRVALALPAR